MTPEHRFLFDCLTYTLGPDGAEPAPPLPGPDMDWEDAVTLAAREGLAGLLYATTRDAAIPVPQPYASHLHMAYLGAVARSEACTAPTLRSALQALHALGMHPIVLKGADLAYTAYPKPHYRSMADFDLLVPPDHAVRAAAALEDMRYSYGGGPLANHHHLPLQTDPEWGLAVEIHHALIAEANPYSIDSRDYLSRLEVAEIAGVEAEVLAPPDALQMACLHLAWSHRYRWYPLRGLADLLAITSSCGSAMDWDELLATARRWRTSGALYWPLRIAAEWLDAPVPAEVLESLVPRSRGRELVAAFADPLFLLDGRSPDGPGGEVLCGILLEYSLHHGCPAATRGRALLQGFFPSPDAVGHLSPRVTGSRWRYAASLCRPDRVIRGTGAVGRLIFGTARAPGRSNSVTGR